MGLIKNKKDEFRIKLKNALKTRGMKQVQLAKETGFKESVISSYCNSRNVPNERNLRKIMTILDIDEDYFEGVYEFTKQNEENKENTVVFDKTDRQEVYIEYKDTTEIIRIAREMGALRYALIQIVEKDREQVNEFNRKDQKWFQTMVHKLEFMDTMTDEEIVKFVREDFKQEKEDRESRRIVKKRMYLVQELLNSMRIKNPNAFVIQAINGEGDILKTMAKLKQDKTLYA